MLHEKVPKFLTLDYKFINLIDENNKTLLNNYYGVYMNNKLITIGKYNENFNDYLPYDIGSFNIYQSDGLKKHILKRHPDCLKYLDLIPDIIAAPDFIGINPNEKTTSFELVKCISENVQIGIKLDTKDNYLYVATLHTITNSKLKHGIQNGRLKKFDNKKRITYNNDT